jgi:hypothetical protein
MVNLLALASVPRDAVYGNWSVTADGLAVQQANGATALEFPYDAPEEYDYEIEFTPQGDGMNVNQYLSAGGHAFAWKLNSHGVSPPLYGFELLDGKYARQRMTEAAVQKPMRIESGKRYTSKIEVRRGSLRALVNGEEYVTWSGDFSRLSMEPHTKMKDERHLGVGSWRRGVVFHRAEVRKVGPAADSAIRSPQSAIAPDAGWPNAINLLPLIDPQKDAVTGTWVWQNGALAVGNTPFERLELPYEPPEEYDFRIVFTRLDGVEGITQVLTKSGNPFAWCVGFKNNNIAAFGTINGVTGGEPGNPSRVQRAAWIENGRPYTMVVTVRNDGLKAFLNDELIAQWKTDYRDMGMFDNWRLRDPKRLGVASSRSRALFHRIEVREVTGKGTLLRKPSN